MEKYHTSMEIHEVENQKNLCVYENETTATWNTREVSLFVRRKYKELNQLALDRPNKITDSQTYYIYRAREEQIKFELDIHESGRELFQGHLIDAFELYGHALNHLKRRNNYETKAYTVWLSRMKAGENPETPDITFVNHGYHRHRLIS